MGDQQVYTRPSERTGFEGEGGEGIVVGWLTDLGHVWVVQKLQIQPDLRVLDNKSSEGILGMLRVNGTGWTCSQ